MSGLLGNGQLDFRGLAGTKLGSKIPKNHPLEVLTPIPARCWEAVGPREAFGILQLWIFLNLLPASSYKKFHLNGMATCACSSWIQTRNGEEQEEPPRSLSV